MDPKSLKQFAAMNTDSAPPAGGCSSAPQLEAGASWAPGEEMNVPCRGVIGQVMNVSQLQECRL